MREKKLVSLFALTLAICVSTPQANGGGAPPDTGAVGAFRTDCTSADWPPKAPSSRVPRRVAGP
jgi:hypothetical protein